MSTCLGQLSDLGAWLVIHNDGVLSVGQVAPLLPPEYENPSVNPSM